MLMSAPSNDQMINPGEVIVLKQVICLATNKQKLKVLIVFHLIIEFRTVLLKLC